MPGALKNARILVADDEASIRMGCERILCAAGHVVETAEDGEIALRKFKENPPDLVILDLMMPERDGLSLIPEIKAFAPGTVIIMITGYASFETAVQAIQLGAYDYVPKPFTPNELKIVVQRALEKRFLILETHKLQAEREKSLRDLALEQSRTRTIINAMGDALLVVNSAQEVVLANPTAENLLFGNTPAPGKPLSELTSWHSVTEAVGKAWASFSDPTVETRALAVEVTSPDNDRTFLMNAAGLFDAADDDPRPQGVVLVLSDISPMKDLERTKSRFVSMVSHELKAPIAAIEGYLDLILGDLPAGQANFQHKLERCRDRAANMQKLIRELLDLSRIEQGRIDRTLRITDPRPIIEETLAFLDEEARKRNITLNLEWPQDIRLQADSGEISQIITNFVSNAVKYNRDNGSVTVRSGIEDRQWKLQIEDTGIGIAPEHLPHIGQEFYRVKNAQTVRISGTGLGMAIVKRLLDLNHARLAIASEPGKGTTITVFWPLSSE